MNRNKQKTLWAAGVLLAAFAIWTLLVAHVDVGEIGPLGSRVGFATLNRAVHDRLGVHLWLYTLTDWLSLVPILTVLGFAVLGLAQWIGRRGLRRVDRDLFVLGGFYAVVMAAYLLFETVVINARPVLINGVLEASYPSSTTVLVLCVMLTAAMQLRDRMASRRDGRPVTLATVAFAVLMVVGRLLSGVHWITDIIGGVLLSAALVTAYDGVLRVCRDGKRRKSD